MNWLLDPLVTLLGLGLLLAFALAIASPFEALGWWAGWSERQLDPHSHIAPPQPLPDAPNDVEGYVVYLTGIGGYSGEFLARRERGFVERLEARLGGRAEIIHDVFPFSVSNNPLNGERVFGWIWEKLHRARLNKHGFIFNALSETIIDLRNIFQIAVSADPRYGPIYNVGVARELARSLLAHGYTPGNRKPIFLIGYSGGAQIAVGVANYLHKGFQTPLYVISIAGVLTDDPGIAYVERVFHLNATHDYIPLLGSVFYPGHWPLLPHSAWNRAKRQKKIAVIDTGPMKHTGRGDYFDRKARLPNGQLHADKTADIVSGIITDTLDRQT